jgi:hypothetical protein
MEVKGNGSMKCHFDVIVVLVLGLACFQPVLQAADEKPPVEISGRYSDLAMMNHQGECGTGAVVPWADRLWVITYAPHKPGGSDDKLYEIDANLQRIIRPESVGGTPADRMIHRESNQLIIGPYFIDPQRNVRVVSPSKMPGRLTAAARDLSDPANKVYVYDMEGALFEVDVHTLAVKKLFARAAPGAHGKGAYTAQDRLVVANNGNSIVNKAKPAADDPEYAADPEASGALAQWDGKTWKVIERREFTDVTGPGGIEGSPDDRAPLWALGWDKRSVMLKLLDGGKWSTFRLPIGDYSYVAKHGWYTEWPRIREVGSGKLLMNMHGQWFDFPKTFSASQTGGIRPVGDYLKITGDFCGWNGRIVFGCDDASIMENPLLGQSQSNLWFSTWENLSHCGRPSGFGGPWVNDDVKAGEPSAPYLFAGYQQRTVHLVQDSDKPVKFTFEMDADGKGKWTEDESVTVPPHGYAFHTFKENLSAEWIRVKTDSDCNGATAYFHYGPGGGAVTKRETFASVADASSHDGWSAGTLRPLGEDSGNLLFAARSIGADGKVTGDHNLVLTPSLKFENYSGPAISEPKEKGAAADYQVGKDDTSIFVMQKKVKYRLPTSSGAADEMPEGVSIRHLREVVTERFLLNVGGSFFDVPRPTAGGAERLKPVCSHNKRFTDFCSWRGIMVIAGNRADAKPDGHYFAAPDGQSGLWLGDIDDLWSLGKPVGHGALWKNESVHAGQASDPFLMAGYDQKTVRISHDSASAVRFVLEVDFVGSGSWHVFHEFDVPPGKTVSYQFPAGYSAHWVRARCNTECHASLVMMYE